MSSSKSSSALLEPVLDALRVFLSFQGGKGQKVGSVGPTAATEELFLLHQVLQSFGKGLLVAPEQLRVDGVQLAVHQGGLGRVRVVLVADEVEVPAEEPEQVGLTANGAARKNGFDALGISSNYDNNIAQIS